MKRIDTQSTLVSAKHGLIQNGKYTKQVDSQNGGQYAYEFHVRAAYGLGCAVKCSMAAPTVLTFKTGNPVTTNVSLVGGFGSYHDPVVPVSPPSAGRQKIELVANVPHGIGSVKFTDAFNVKVV